MSRKPSAVYANRMERYPDAVWLIWSNKWGCWYRDKCSGYTDDIAHAGLYDREVARRHYPGNVARRYRDVEPFPLSTVRAMIDRRKAELRAEVDRIDEAISRIELLAAASSGGE